MMHTYYALLLLLLLLLLLAFTFAMCRRPTVCRLSSVTFVHPTQAIEIFGSVLRHFMRWPSVDIQVKFYGDRPNNYK